MTQVFISYKREDRHLTEDLASYLETLGYSVWWDTRLVSGDDIDDVIVKAIDAAEAAIVIWTRNSIGSKWVKSEARRADRQGKLIPVRVPDLDANEVPPPFDGYHMDLLADRERIAAALVARGVMPRTSALSPSSPSSSSAPGEGTPGDTRGEELRRKDEARTTHTAAALTKAAKGKAPYSVRALSNIDREASLNVWRDFTQEFHRDPWKSDLRVEFLVSHKSADAALRHNYLYDALVAYSGMQRNHRQLKRIHEAYARKKTQLVRDSTFLSESDRESLEKLVAGGAAELARQHAQCMAIGEAIARRRPSALLRTAAFVRSRFLS